jgi:3-oxoacyl-[acyl-carrier protein] reductase
VNLSLTTSAAKLEGRNAIITGASSGLGYALARSFLANGAKVAICGRNEEALERARMALSGESADREGVFAMRCDVSSEASVAAFMRAALNEFGTVHALVNNAAILGPVGRSDALDLDGWRNTLEVNFFGVLFACRALVPHFYANGYGKIINLSGGGATSPRPFFSPYAVSKTAVVRFSENLAMELKGSGIDVNAVAPGALNTRMLDQTLAAGPHRMGEAQFAEALRQRQTGGSSIERAAALIVHLASPASDGVTGRLISAPWDPWERLQQYAVDLENTDIYTLRRIVPEDRAKSWND